MSDHKFSRAFRGKGYYIALILCAVAIGISGYVYYQNSGLSQPDAQVLATDPTSDVQLARPDQIVEATEPAGKEDVPAPTVGKLSVCLPVQGQVAAEYAMEVLSYNQTTRDWRVHNGVDYAAQAGTAVVAAAEGQVYTVYDDEQMGTTVVIRHAGGYTTKYSSLASEVAVAPGDQVSMGQTIGAVGATALMESAIGDHVHFSVTLNDEPVDPAEFLNP